MMGSEAAATNRAKAADRAQEVIGSVCASPAEIVWLRSGQYLLKGGVAEVQRANQSDGFLDEIREAGSATVIGTILPSAIAYDSKGSSAQPAEREKPILPAQDSRGRCSVESVLVMEDYH